MKWFKETGLMKRDELRWIPNKPDCEGGLRGFITVGLMDTKPAGLLLLIGYVSSVIILLAEIFIRKIHHINRYKTQTDGRFSNKQKTTRNIKSKKPKKNNIFSKCSN